METFSLPKKGIDSTSTFLGGIDVSDSKKAKRAQLSLASDLYYKVDASLST